MLDFLLVPTHRFLVRWELLIAVTDGNDKLMKRVTKFHIGRRAVFKPEFRWPDNPIITGVPWPDRIDIGNLGIPCKWLIKTIKA